MVDTADKIHLVMFYVAKSTRRPHDIYLATITKGRLWITSRTDPITALVCALHLKAVLERRLVSVLPSEQEVFIRSPPRTWHRIFLFFSHTRQIELAE